MTTTSKPPRSNVAAYERWWNAGRRAALSIRAAAARNATELQPLLDEIAWIDEREKEAKALDATRRGKRKAG